MSADATPEELQHYYDAIVDVAKRAGGMIAATFKQPASNVEFKGATDLVTETDKACEELIISTLKSKFPDHVFVGEEVRFFCAFVFETLFLMPSSELTVIAERCVWRIDRGGDQGENVHHRPH